MANSLDPDETAENGKQRRPDQTAKKEWQIVKTLIIPLRMANSVDTDQTENGK